MVVEVDGAGLEPQRHAPHPAALVDLGREYHPDVQGLVLSDETVLKEMDSEIGKNSNILPARITSTGISGSVADAKQFETLSAFVKKTVQKLLSSLADGNIDIAPYRKTTSSACDFCKLSAFCAHDGSGYRNFEKQAAQEIWNEMEAEA